MNMCSNLSLAFWYIDTNERFGVIEFAVGVPVTEAYRKAVREVAESHWEKLFRKVNGEMQYCLPPPMAGFSNSL